MSVLQNRVPDATLTYTTIYVLNKNNKICQNIFFCLLNVVFIGYWKSGLDEAKILSHDWMVGDHDAYEINYAEHIASVIMLGVNKLLFY